MKCRWSERAPRALFERNHAVPGTRALLCAVALSASGLFGCEQKPKAGLLPASSALAEAKPTSNSAQVFAIDRASSKVEFMMDAELEKISGRAPAALDGQLFVDFRDISKSSGLVKLDLDQLSIYQKKRAKAGGEFSPEVKNEKQNADMHTWFEIGSDAPPDARQQNRWVEFKIKRIEQPTANDLGAQAGAERSLSATIVGDFRLHGRVKERSAKVRITVHYEADQPQLLHVETVEPFQVALEEHDVRPRSAFSKLADKTLDALGAKVAKVALISVDFSARASGTK
jgi:hypothetical protein